MKMPWLKTTEPVTSSLTKTYTSNNPTADGALTVTLAETLWTAMERRMEAVPQNWRKNIRRIENLLAALRRHADGQGQTTSLIMMSMGPGSISPQVVGWGALADAPDFKEPVGHLLRILANAQTSSLSKSFLQKVRASVSSASYEFGCKIRRKF